MRAAMHPEGAARFCRIAWWGSQHNKIRHTLIRCAYLPKHYITNRMVSFNLPYHIHVPCRFAGAQNTPNNTKRGLTP